MRKIMFIALLIGLYLHTRGVSSNPLPNVMVTEFSTSDDWIEIEGVLVNSWFIVNSDTVYIDSTKVSYDFTYNVLDSDNTSGFDLPDEGCDIAFPMEGEYFRYNESLASLTGESAAIISSYYFFENMVYIWGLTKSPTPGERNYFDLTSDDQGIMINEAGPYGEEQFVELYNRSSGPVDISGWEIKAEKTYIIEDNTIIQAQTFYTTNAGLPDGFFPDIEEYWADSKHTVILLFDSGGYFLEIAHLNVYKDKDGVSYSRYPDGNPSAHIESFPTPGAPNHLKETSVTDEPPIAITLHQNTPNPFNPRTAIPVTNDRSGHVTLTVYNVTGQAVRTLYDGILTAGYHSFIWDGKDSTGREASSGVYVYRLDAGWYSESRTMALVR